MQAQRPASAKTEAPPFECLLLHTREGSSWLGSAVLKQPFILSLY